MKFNVAAFCPHCGVENNYLIEVHSELIQMSLQYTNIEYCDKKDARGCGKRFVMDWELTPTIHTQRVIDKDDKGEKQ